MIIDDHRNERNRNIIFQSIARSRHQFDEDLTGRMEKWPKKSAWSSVHKGGENFQSCSLLNGVFKATTVDRCRWPAEEVGRLFFLPQDCSCGTCWRIRSVGKPIKKTSRFGRFPIYD